MLTKYNIDIIIPNYNKSKYLEQCINSVIDQSYKNWNLYIVDDCSSDDSLSVLKKYNNNKQIEVIKLNKNKGPAFCRNLAMRISNSEYISFLDSDDYWKKDKLYKQLNFMEQNKYKFTYTDYLWFKEKSLKKIFKSTNIVEKFTYNEFLKNSSINSSTMMLKRNLIENVKFKKVNHEDFLFKCDILRKGINAYKLDDKLSYYRIIDTSRSASKLLNLFSLWKINSSYNKLNFLLNIVSILSISVNSLKKYGLK